MAVIYLLEEPSRRTLLKTQYLSCMCYFFFIERLLSCIPNLPGTKLGTLVVKIYIKLLLVI